MAASKLHVVLTSFVTPYLFLACQYGTTLPYALMVILFFYKSLFVAGVTTVSNLHDETSSRFLTFEAFKENYTVKTNFLQYHSVVTALLNAKKNFVFNQTSNTEQLVGSKNFCKLAYNKLIMRQASLPQRNQDKRISDFQAYAVEEIDWSKTYSLPFLCTRETKLRVFQFKLIHR